MSSFYFTVVLYLKQNVGLGTSVLNTPMNRR